MKRKVLCLGIIAVLMTAAWGCGDTNKSSKEKTETTEEASTEISTETVEETEEEQETPEEIAEEIVESEEEEVEATGAAVVDIPSGFKEYLAPSGIYVTTKYPEDGSNIYIMTSPYYGELPGEAEYTRKINENLSAQVGEIVKIDLIEFEKTTVEGCDATRALYTYSHDGMNFKRLEYTVNTDITTTIAYTQEGDADWMDVFEESALTIRIGE